MSEQLEYGVYVEGDARKAAILGRRLAYARGWAGLKVTSAVELPQPANSQQRHFRVTIMATERRVGNQWSAVMAWTRGGRALAWMLIGNQVRTKAPGIDYTGGSRHVIPAEVEGVIVGHRYPNLLIGFPELPGRRILYAPQDLEALPS
jgi:hypothetical protein